MIIIFLLPSAIQHLHIFIKITISIILHIRPNPTDFESLSLTTDISRIVPNLYYSFRIIFLNAFLLPLLRFAVIIIAPHIAEDMDSLSQGILLGGIYLIIGSDLLNTGDTCLRYGVPRVTYANGQSVGGEPKSFCFW